MSDAIKVLPMKSVCVGRFVLDVPLYAVVSYRPARVSGWNVSTTQESNEEFYARVRQKKGSLDALKNERGGASLEIFRDVSNEHVKGSIFLFDRKWSTLMRSGKEIISESVAIDALARSNGVSYEFQAEFRDPSKIDELEKILLQLRSVSESEIPSESGFCFDHGLILDPLTIESYEYVSVFLGTEEQPDLALSLSSSAGINIHRTLLQRHENSPIQREHPLNFHDFHVGPRTINGVAGEEVLQRVREENGTKAHGFMWESLASNSDVYLPSLVLELDTGLGRPGEPVNSSLSDAEALALWEKISSSLRRRPVR
ncbi:T6SS immunity protein Tli4 family protein [Duganella sp. BuS-21]|uniref:T6SS immunity protein Tli4 family protein n=1 Tax=Duganella sp. BuS-21 TaxID=2943848 RepID=UPI0035A68046